MCRSIVCNKTSEYCIVLLITYTQRKLSVIHLHRYANFATERVQIYRPDCIQIALFTVNMFLFSSCLPTGFISHVDKEIGIKQK